MAKKKTKRSKPHKAATKFSIRGFLNKLSGEQLRFGVAVVLLALAVFMLVALFSYFVTGYSDQAGLEENNLSDPANAAGGIGAAMSDLLLNRSFGIFSFLIPVFLIEAAMWLMKAYKLNLFKCFLHQSLIMVWGSVTLSAMQGLLPEVNFRWGGAHGDLICQWLGSAVGSFGTVVILLLAAVCYMLAVSERSVGYLRSIMGAPAKLKGPLGRAVEVVKRKVPQRSVQVVPPMSREARRLFEEDGDEPLVNERLVEITPQVEPFEEPAESVAVEIKTDKLSPVRVLKRPREQTVSGGAAKEQSVRGNVSASVGEESGKAIDFTATAAKSEQTAKGDAMQVLPEDMEPYDPRKSLENYKFPTLELLKKYADGGQNVDEQEQTANANRIIEVLRNFDVQITKISATIGPTITLYEITPASGVRISKIRNLEDDIALSLSALGIRIIAPIPGKGTIGIEVPNQRPRIVSMESVLNSRRFESSNYELPVALGKTITNEVLMVDLTKMPHLLVAGATGQGKSVGLNALITSLLYKKHPAELKFVMVDPKKVELSTYAPLEKYFLATLPDQDDPIITDVSKVVETLKSLCQLMDHRYDLLKMARVRNIKEYNDKFKRRLLNPKNGHEFMPYVVIIIDEFGDLIMTAGKEVELPIARIAQLARAVGMHMVIATQRPTTNIITGTIKANFPARMAFKVMSQIDSRTILDRTGANQLVGRGDMLFLSGMTGADPVRVQCAFVDTPEVERVCQFVETQPGYLPPYSLPEVVGEEADGSGNQASLEQLDPMFDEVARMIVAQQQGSTSLIQRKFSIGYNRAGRLMDQLELAGIVGPARGSKPREVLIADPIHLDQILEDVKH